MPPGEVRDAAAEVQERLARFDWLALTPRHFLHVWVAGTHGVDVDELATRPPFPAAYARVACFHDAVVAEVEAPELAGVPAPPTYLPHLTLAYVREPVPPEPLRAVLRALREQRLGTGTVDELLRVRFPFARSTVLEPWRSSSVGRSGVRLSP